MSDSYEGEEEEHNTIGTYEGERNEAKQRHGYGVAHLPNGDIYRGFYLEGKRHGRGHYRFKKNGSRYTGEWREGKKHGRGMFIYPDGTKYEGYWEDDLRTGQGTYHFANGNKYVGGWRDDMRQGMGICFYPAMNCKYVGEWENDRRHGKGALVHQDHRYEGVWKDDLPDGPGCYVFGDNLVQEGVYTVRQLPADEEELIRSGDEDEPPASLVPVWRADRVLAGEAAVSRIQHGLSELERVASHVSIGSVVLPPEKPPPPAAEPTPPTEDAGDAPTEGAQAVDAEGAPVGEGAADAEGGEVDGEVDPEADQLGGDETELEAPDGGTPPQDLTMELRDGDPAEADGTDEVADELEPEQTETETADDPGDD